MIVPSMTYFEMFEHLNADYSKIKVKYLQLEYKAVKELKKSKKFPAFTLFEYTIPATKNSYVVYFYANTQTELERPKVDCYSVVYDSNSRFVVKWGCSPYRHNREDEDFVQTRMIKAYSSLFFHRYKERVLRGLKSISIDEVACRYFIENPVEFPIELDDEIIKNYKKYGDFAKYGIFVNDGICLIRQGIEVHQNPDTNLEIADAIGRVYVTFIDKDTLKPSQKEAIMKEYIRYSGMLMRDISDIYLRNKNEIR